MSPVTTQTQILMEKSGGKCIREKLSMKKMEEESIEVKKEIDLGWKNRKEEREGKRKIERVESVNRKRRKVKT
uniref:Uncharacterized protein n=1 Tax=Pristionchus pacificus TaxID=54126 RepID=A0A2A6B6V8_PRIPA|eukprot:PDM61607.1 hypothetical protein PRIPAC_51049 [Pristionchus pacificus]